MGAVRRRLIGSMGLVLVAPALARAQSKIARILKGAKPGELPISQASEFDLLINRGAAGVIE